MAKQHHYTTTTRWTGNQGSGTSSYRAYSRDHDISAPGVPVTLPGSSDPAFRGDPARYNPEQLFLASLSACHMLWYLHLAATAGLTVMEYVDEAAGVLEEDEAGSGRMTEIELRPRVRILEAERTEEAEALHHAAGRMCFLARSVSCAIRYRATTLGVGA